VILTAVQERSLGYARDDDSAKHYQNSAALPYFYAPHHHFAFLISNFSFKRRFQTESKGSTPQRLTLNSPTFPIFLLHFALNPAIILTYMYKQRWEEAGKFLTESRRGWKGGRKETAGHPGADSEICPRRTLRANERSVTDYLGGTAEALFRPMWMKEIFLL
uniref:hypothetical protein n=1 Tax=Dialister sp. TaxID=1955814 RepID=UPI00402A36C3